MIRVVTIRVELLWEPQDPDGTECCLCGDVCFLSMWRLFVRKLGAVAKSETKYCRCQSCYEEPVGVEDQL